MVFGVNDQNTPPEDALAAGTYAGEYVIEALIGQGVFGTVYRARHPVIGAPAAVKVLDARLSKDPRMISRFIDEARAASRARHPSIVEVFNFGRLPDGRRYFVMELLEGEPLDALLARRGRLELTECVTLLAPIADALAVAHAAGVTHRDIKPANIYICADGPPKLVDFGVAKLLDGRATRDRTAKGVLVGTPSYMSPEQCLGEQITPAADVYALGVVAWEMLAGRLPFVGESSVAVMNAHIADSPPPLHRDVPGLNPSVTAALEAMLAKDPTARPDPVAGIAALTAGVADAGTRRRGWAMAGVLLAAGLGAGVWFAMREPPARPPSAASGVTLASDSPPRLAVDAAVTEAAPATRPAPVRFTIVGLPKDGAATIGGEVVDFDDKGRFDRGTDGLPATLSLNAPGHRSKAVELRADTTAIDARLERIPRTDRPVRKANPHGIDPW